MKEDSFINKISKDSKKRHLFIGTIIFGILLFFLIFSNNGLLRRFELEVEKYEIQENILNKKNKLDQSKEEIELLKSDTLEMERIAREKYGYIKEGEKTYILKKKEK